MQQLLDWFLSDKVFSRIKNFQTCTPFIGYYRFANSKPITSLKVFMQQHWSVSYVSQFIPIMYVHVCMCVCVCKRAKVVVSILKTL